MGWMNFWITFSYFLFKTITVQNGVNTCWYGFTSMCNCICWKVFLSFLCFYILLTPLLIDEFWCIHINLLRKTSWDFLWCIRPVQATARFDNLQLKKWRKFVNSAQHWGHLFTVMLMQHIFVYLVMQRFIGRMNCLAGTSGPLCVTRADAILLMFSAWITKC
jgi:hypothetical protein